MSNSIVLVFTNYKKWLNLSNTIKDRVNYDEWNISYQNIEKDHVIRFTQVEGKCTLTKVQQLSVGNIYLIYDNLLSSVFLASIIHSIIINKNINKANDIDVLSPVNGSITFIKPLKDKSI